MDAKRAPFQFSPPGRALFHYRERSGDMVAAHGPPHYAPGGPRRLPAWGFEFSESLILELQVSDEIGLCYVHGPLRELRHAILRLGVPEDRIVWRMDDDWTAFERALEAYHPADWGRWTVVGPGIAPIECLSPGEAEWRLAGLVESGADVRIEQAPVQDARARRKRILATGKAQRRLPGETERQHRWEVWQVGPGESKSLLAMFVDQDQADSFRRERHKSPHDPDVRFEVRLRAR